MSAINIVGEALVDMTARATKAEARLAALEAAAREVGIVMGDEGSGYGIRLYTTDEQDAALAKLAGLVEEPKC